MVIKRGGFFYPGRDERFEPDCLSALLALFLVLSVGFSLYLWRICAFGHASLYLAGAIVLTLALFVVVRQMWMPPRVPRSRLYCDQ